MNPLRAVHGVLVDGLGLEPFERCGARDGVLAAVVNFVSPLGQHADRQVADVDIEVGVLVGEALEHLVVVRRHDGVLRHDGAQVGFGFDAAAGGPHDIDVQLFDVVLGDQVGIVGQRPVALFADAHVGGDALATRLEHFDALDDALERVGLLGDRDVGFFVGALDRDAPGEFADGQAVIDEVLLREPHAVGEDHDLAEPQRRGVRDRREEAAL